MKWKQLFRYGAIVVIALPVVIYICLVTLQMYSAWQAAGALDKLQRLRLGDPAAAFTNVVSKWKSDRGEYFWLEPIPYRADWYGWLWNHISPRTAGRVADISVLFRLRYWRLSASPRFEGGQIASVSTTLVVFNREESVGGGWTLAPSMDEPYFPPTIDRDIPTFVHWFHITSTVGGYGYRVITTPRSSADDLNAREMNYACLLPFRHCGTPFELLPNVAPLIEKQKLAMGN